MWANSSKVSASLWALKKSKTNIVPSKTAARMYARESDNRSFILEPFFPLEIPDHTKDPGKHDSRDNPEISRYAHDGEVRGIHPKNPGEQRKREHDHRKNRKQFYDLIRFIGEQRVVCLFKRYDSFFISFEI